MNFRVVKRLGVGLLCAIATLAATTLHAQNETIITISKPEIVISEAFAQIEKQTGYIVAVNLDKFDVSRKVVLINTRGTINQIMVQLLAGSKVSYRIAGRYISVVPRIEIPYVPEKKDYAAGTQFNSNVKEYTADNLKYLNDNQRQLTEYDTVRTVIRQDDFKYESAKVQFTPAGYAGRSATRNTPPMLAVKTNLLYWATTTPNIAGEIGLGKRTSFEIAGSNNRWNLNGDDDNNKKLVHWVIKPEFRVWTCERFNGHFFGIHGFYSKFNVAGYNIPTLFDSKYRYQGDAYGAGVSYGYHWVWSKRWGMEFNIGAGVAKVNYKKSDCAKCGSFIEKSSKTYVGPTSAAIKLVYMIR